MKTGAAIGTGGGAALGGLFGGPAGALIGAGIGGSLGGMFDDDPVQQAQAQQIDPNDPRFLYGLQGGVGEGAGFDNAAAAAGSRIAPTTNYAQADADYARQLQARNLQMGEVARLQGVLDGTGPTTQAQLALAQGNRDAINAGQQMAATARGTNALIQQRAANVGAVLGGQRASEQAAMLRAREIDAAGAQMQGLAGGMRSQDMGSRAESAGQAQFGTQTQMEQRRLNDAQRLGLYGLGNDARQAQLDANVRIAQGNQGATNGMSTFNAGQRSDADQRDRQAQAGLMNGLMQVGENKMNADNAAAEREKDRQAYGARNGGGGGGGYGSNPYAQGGGYARPEASKQPSGWDLY
ncbi:hypothetical protein K0U83_13775 [bacterium]|nr:hypothetical protein [bacterium]